MDKIQEVQKHAPKSRGKTCLIKHLQGKRLTQRQAILAKCCECTGYYADGRTDCSIPDCPLYPFFPYKGSLDAVKGTDERAIGKRQG